LQKDELLNKVINMEIEYPTRYRVLMSYSRTSPECQL
jgi:hypothetical protein